MIKNYKDFKKVMQYCKLMDYSIDDILNMSDNELRIWFNLVEKMTKNETEFRIKTGLSLDNNGDKHKVLSIVHAKFERSGLNYGKKIFDNGTT